MTSTMSSPPILLPEGEARFEEWECLVRGKRGVMRWSLMNEVSVESVSGRGARFFITPEQRRRNQSTCRKKLNDPFTNGSFRLVEGVEGVTEIAGADTPMSDEDINDLIDSRFEQFKLKLASISQPVTLERVYAACRVAGVGGQKMACVTFHIKRMRPNAALIGDVLNRGNEDSEAFNNARGPSRTDADGSERGGPDIDAEVDGGTGPRKYNLGI